MQKTNHLLGTAGEGVIEFGIGAGRLKQSGIFEREFINVESMKSRIESWLHEWTKQEGMCS
jgi:hypothetical protein